jgi:hypothetical protein
MVDVGMGDDGIMDHRSFSRVAWWRGGGNSVIKQQSCTFSVFKNDPNVSNFVSTSKIMESQTMVRGFLWIGRCSTWRIQDHDDWRGFSSKKVWVSPLDFHWNRIHVSGD